MTRPRARRDVGSVLIVLAVVVIVGAGGFAYSFCEIFSSVREISEIAAKRYDGDTVQALMALIESKDASFGEKNRAIWALGQIGDRRALPLLKRLNTHEIQTKPYNPDRYIVQYSVEKAIRQIRSRSSLTRWMYRRL